ncbi:Golgi membrane protein 1 isoform X2 [Megalops cyprinoides]|uniref:Golgi membrane protein 1 isoform X2 n=1 Tax=Megalops cyprinoides TaxID=118141 RepID=UPI001864D0D7|nr:Golgi membrane protein 1 isoform X2 [Megalops cyprinoides]
MGALGNGRRGGRSPPLLIGALIACVLVLGFNYWVSNSRNIELQTRLYDLEGSVRRAAAEQAAVEQKKNEFQEQLQRQIEQINRIEAAHKKQLENTQASWMEEKANLLLNISSSTKTILTMKAQFNALFDNLGKIQKELQDCQSNQSILNKKLTYDMTQCNAQIVALKEECGSKVAVAKQEAEKKPEKKSTPVIPPSQAKVTGEGMAEKVGQDDTKKASVQAQKISQTPSNPDSHKTNLSELETNDIILNKDGDALVSLSGKDLTNPERKLVPVDGKQSDAPQQGGIADIPNRLSPEELEVLDMHDEALPAQGLVPKEKPGDYNGEEHNKEKSKMEKQTQLTGKVLDTNQAEQELEDELADYNGDEENVGEFEADKQAELAEI